MLSISMTLFLQTSDEVLDHLLDLAERVRGKLLDQHAQPLAVKALALRREELPHTPVDACRAVRVALAAGDLYEGARRSRRGELREGEVALGGAGHLRRGQDLHGLVDGLDLLRPEPLLLLVGDLVLAAVVLGGLERLLALSLDVAGSSELLLVLGCVLSLALLLDGPRVDLLLRVLHGICKVHHYHLVSVLGVHLLLLTLRQLGLELSREPLQQVDDAAGLELVGVGLGSLVARVVRVLAHGVHERGEDGPGLLRQLGTLGELQEGGLATGAVVGLLLQDRDRPLQGVHALRVVLRLRQELVVVLGSLVLLGLQVRLCHGGLAVERGDVLAQGLDVALELLDARPEHHDLLAALADLALQARDLLRAPGGELGECHLCIFLLLL
mmetsp:Transcript_80251/g.236035  ORF Transcript_80251/g.236035 Transcript_80251/m.236035 type:complete len:385 (-) Transcript_80251:196-1350(-)